MGGLPVSRLVRDHRLVLSEREFQTAVDSAFEWLGNRGFRTTVRSFGLLGHVATLTDERHWLQLRWETHENAIFLSWGDHLPPGQFNDDPYRNPRPLPELIGPSSSEIWEAGAARSADDVAPALQRLSNLLVDAGALTKFK